MVRHVAYGGLAVPTGVAVFVLACRRFATAVTARRAGRQDTELGDERGSWGSDTVNLPVAGTRTVKATVRVSGIDRVTVAKTLAIRR